MTALDTLVEPLKRELAVPGAFDAAFPNTSDDDLIESLADGFGEAQLMGFFPTYELTGGEGSWETSLDLSAAGGALVVIFTAMRILRAQIRSQAGSERYKAGPVEIETTRSANVLRDELKFLSNRLDMLIAEGKRASRPTSVAVFDNYTTRTAIQLHRIGGFAPLELPAAVGW